MITSYSGRTVSSNASASKTKLHFMKETFLGNVFLEDFAAEERVCEEEGVCEDVVVVVEADDDAVMVEDDVKEADEVVTLVEEDEEDVSMEAADLTVKDDCERLDAPGCLLERSVPRLFREVSSAAKESAESPPAAI